MKKIVMLIFLVFTITGPSNLLPPRPAAAAEETWKTEFDRVCGQTDNAADMSIDELKNALSKCDALKPLIEALEATPRKVYLKRLQLCRNLFAFLLEKKEQK